MCLAIPGKILSIEESKALVDFDGIRKKVIIALVPNVQVGNYVIVHAGYAIETIDEAAAIESLQIWKEALLKDAVSKDDLF